MFAVFVAFVPEGDSSLKPIALGLAAGIAIDAFLVRMTLIPALMAILGERAWELPAWLEKILPRVDVRGRGRWSASATWPNGRGDGSIVAADDLDISADAPIVENLSLRIPEGGALVATGGDVRARRALALHDRGPGDTYRRSTPASRAICCPDAAPGCARTSAACWSTTPTPPLADLAEALRGKSQIVVIDGIDRLTGGLARPGRRDAARCRGLPHARGVRHRLRCRRGRDRSRGRPVGPPPKLSTRVLPAGAPQESTEGDRMTLPIEARALPQAHHVADHSRRAAAPGSGRRHPGRGPAEPDRASGLDDRGDRQPRRAGHHRRPGHPARTPARPQVSSRGRTTSTRT